MCGTGGAMHVLRIDFLVTRCPGYVLGGCPFPAIKRDNAKVSFTSGMKTEAHVILISISVSLVGARISKYPTATKKAKAR